MNWFEELPPSCPPADAVPCDGQFYRIAKGNPAEDSDFFSQRKMQPDKVFKGLIFCFSLFLVAQSGF